MVAAALTAIVFGLAAPVSAGDDALPLAPHEVRQVLRHGPWPPPPPHDASNRLSGNAHAIALGQRLFFDSRLSATGTLACATCHVPARAWTDGRRRAVGLAPLDRNTPSVVDVGLQRWFGWDGRSDSLWSQSLKPIVDGRELGASGAHVARLVHADATLACLHARALGAPARGGDADADEATLVAVGKALAAFLETLVSARTPFDDFRDALARGDVTAARAYPAAALRGLRIVLAGGCAVCHVGPAFTDGEFHDVGVPFLLGPGRVDAGRHQGIKALRADRFNLLGPWSDDATRATAVKTRHVELQHASFGQFRTPSLRNVALTAPYMHDGRYGSLREVVRHYSELDMERIHAHGEQLLRPLRLTDSQIGDVVAFLETLTSRPAPLAPPRARRTGCER